MSSVSLNLPVISDDNVVLSEQEAKEVFVFFWPQKKQTIGKMSAGINERRYAQALLIVAVDASYLMGFVEQLVDVLLRRKPGTSIQTLVKKLTRKYVKHWWEHVTQENLSDAKVYDTVRQTTALKQKTRFEMMLLGIAALPQALLALDMPSANTGSLAWV